MRFSARIVIVLGVVTGGLLPRAFADLPASRLTSVFPPGAQRGTFREVTIAGADLDDLTELRFSHPGLTARPALDPAGKPQPNKFTVAVWPDTPIGTYDVRAVGRFGISNPRAFAIGDAPEVAETANNTSPGGATEIPVGATASGQCAASAVDHFRFSAKQGQRVVITCAAAEIDSKTEPVVTLSDPLGRELGRSRSGEPIDFTAPADGSWVLQVHDAVFRGGPEYSYRLTVSAAPRVDFILPPAGQAGTKAKFVLYGRSLPGSSPAPANVTLDGARLEQLPVEIDLPAAAAAPAPSALSDAPAQAAVRTFEYRLKTDKGASNPLVLSLTETPPVPEHDPNDKPAEAQKLTAPCEVTGQFFPRGDRDWYAFDAKKGDVFWLEVFCQRLGLAADPFLLVQRVTKNDKGEEQASDVQEVYDSDTNAGGPDFNTASRDPAYRLEVKEDGTYRVLVRDLFNTLHDDPALVYRLSVRREKPDFLLAALPARGLPAEQPLPPLLRKGGAVPVRVVAVRRDGFNGDIQLSAQGLPPGVKCPDVTLPAGANAASLVFTAAEDAAGWTGTLHVVGKAQVGGAEVSREATGAAVLWPTAADPAADPPRTRLTADGFPMSVSATEAAPLSIEPADAKPLEAAAGSTLKVPLKVKARFGAGGKLKVKPLGHPALGPAADAEVEAKSGDASLDVDLNKLKLPPGTHTLYVRAEGPVKYLRNPEALKAAEEARERAEKASTEAAAATKQAAEKLAEARKGADAEATKAAEKAAAEADAKAKEAEKQKAAATKAVADAGPKDTPAVVYSPPIVVNVTAKK